jgi:uncharacterized protein (TIGR03382 family)
MKNGIVALVALAGLATGAMAANTWTAVITYSNPANRIINDGDTATVEIWAGFDDNLYAFAGGAFAVNTDDAAGSWSDFDRDLTGPGTKGGTANGGNVTDIITGQLHFPPANIFADTSNPILAWHGTFTTTDLSFRDVALSTASTKFDIYINDAGVSDQFLDSLVELAGTIGVGVPTPGTAALLGLGALAAGRRRR